MEPEDVGEQALMRGLDYLIWIATEGLWAGRVPLTTRAVHSLGRRYARRPCMTSRLIAQMKAASSRAIAVATTVRRLPLLSRSRKRLHSRVWAFHAISRTRLGAAATFACFSRPTRVGCR